MDLLKAVGISVAELILKFDLVSTGASIDVGVSMPVVLHGDVAWIYPRPQNQDIIGRRCTICLVDVEMAIAGLE